METLNQDVTEILRGGANEVENVGEIACRVFVWLEGLLIGFLRCRLRVTLVEILLRTI